MRLWINGVPSWRTLAFAWREYPIAFADWARSRWIRRVLRPAPTRPLQYPFGRGAGGRVHFVRLGR